MCAGAAGAGRAPAQIAGGGGCASCCSGIPENLREAVERVQVFAFNQCLSELNTSAVPRNAAL